MVELTARQDQILSFIIDFRAKNAKSPSLREIQAHFSFSSIKSVQDHLSALKKKGRIEKGIGARGIIPVGPSATLIPLLGQIAAGIPIEAIEHVETHLDLTSFGLDNSKEEFFGLRVKGESMINVHILDGDIVIIKRQPQVADHEIAAIYWNGDVTLKFIDRKKGEIFLVPANDNLSPVRVSSEKVWDFRILGKVIKTIRSH